LTTLLSDHFHPGTAAQETLNGNILEEDSCNLFEI
jgi:hypothetical protein